LIPGASPVVGKSVPRREDGALITGAGSFVDDIRLPGMLHAAFVRSPLAHARIVGIDTAAAASMPGVVAVVTAAELDVEPLTPPLDNPEAQELPRPLLADGVVRFSGEPLAVVVADSPYRAEDAAEQVIADLEPLPVITDPEAAVEAPPIHAHVPS